jgi:hypothetical protein
MTMSVDEFQRILNNGLGRAILFLQQNDSTPYREVILNACLHNTAYDAQVEGTRVEYMHNIIHLTSEENFYREQILDALLKPDQRDWDDIHLLDQAAIFAKAGDKHARQAVYNRLLHHPGSVSHYDVLIDMDGIKGLINLVEEIWQLDPDDRQEFISSFGEELLMALERHDGEDQTQKNLLAISETNPNVKEFVESVSADRAGRKYSIKREKRPNISYSELKSWISTNPDLNHPPIKWSLWGKYASDEDIVLAANDLLLLDDEEAQKITIYSDMFRKRMFPLDPTRLINWASQIDDRDIWKSDGTIDYEARRSLYALNALELVMDWAVRDLALSLIESKNNSGRAVGLLGINFVEGDWQLIEQLTQTNTNTEDYHSLGLSILEVFDAHPSAEAAAVFQHLYEWGNCSACRERFVQRLVSLNALPQWMLKECQYDCNLDLRELAAEIANMN